MAKAKQTGKPQRPAPRNEQSAAIVDATVAAATELGPSASVEAIAKRAGVGSASVYRYFPTKAALFAEVGRRVHLRMKEEIIASSRGVEFDEGIERICRMGLEVSQFPESVRRHLHEEVPWSWVDETARVTTEEIVEALVEAIERTTQLPIDRPALQQRVIVAISIVRGAALSALRFPNLTGPASALLPDVVRAVRACLGVDESRT